jgi:hypothetical protein
MHPVYCLHLICTFPEHCLFCLLATHQRPPWILTESAHPRWLHYGIQIAKLPCNLSQLNPVSSSTSTDRCSYNALNTWFQYRLAHWLSRFLQKLQVRHDRCHHSWPQARRSLWGSRKAATCSIPCWGARISDANARKLRTSVLVCSAGSWRSAISEMARDILYFRACSYWIWQRPKSQCRSCSL